MEYATTSDRVFIENSLMKSGYVPKRTTFNVIAANILLHWEGFNDAEDEFEIGIEMYWDAYAKHDLASYDYE